MQADSQVTLVERARGGEEAAWEALLVRYDPLFWRCARKWRPFSLDVEDAYQEVRLQFCRAVYEWSPAKGSLVTLTCLKSKSAFRDMWRRVSERERGKNLSIEEVEQDELPRVEFPIGRALAAALMKAVFELRPPPDGCRAYLRARLLGMSVPELAKAEGRSPGGTKQSFLDWRARLKRDYPGLFE